MRDVPDTARGRTGDSTTDERRAKGKGLPAGSSVPRPVDPLDLESLQRAIGNEAVVSLLTTKTAPPDGSLGGGVAPYPLRRQSVPPVRRTILDPEVESTVIDVEAEKRRNRLLNDRLQSPTGGRLAPGDPRFALLAPHLGDKSQRGPDDVPVPPSTAGARATGEAQDLLTMQGKLSSTVDPGVLGSHLVGKSLRGPDDVPAPLPPPESEPPRTPRRQGRPRSRRRTRPSVR